MSREYINEFKKLSRFATMKQSIKIMLKNAFLKMKYRKKIKENNVFRNRYKGDTCFVIGNGPSLTAIMHTTSTSVWLGESSRCAPMR